MGNASQAASLLQFFLEFHYTESVSSDCLCSRPRDRLLKYINKIINSGGTIIFKDLRSSEDFQQRVISLTGGGHNLKARRDCELGYLNSQQKNFHPIIKSFSRVREMQKLGARAEAGRKAHRLQ